MIKEYCYPLNREWNPLNCDLKERRQLNIKELNKSRWFWRLLILASDSPPLTTLLTSAWSLPIGMTQTALCSVPPSPSCHICSHSKSKPITSSFGILSVYIHPGAKKLSTTVSVYLEADPFEPRNRSGKLDPVTKSTGTLSVTVASMKTAPRQTSFGALGELSGSLSFSPNGNTYTGVEGQDLFLFLGAMTKFWCT